MHEHSSEKPFAGFVIIIVRDIARANVILHGVMTKYLKLKLWYFVDILLAVFQRYVCGYPITQRRYDAGRQGTLYTLHYVERLHVCKTPTPTPGNTGFTHIFTKQILYKFIMHTHHILQLVMITVKSLI